MNSLENHIGKTGGCRVYMFFSFVPKTYLWVLVRTAHRGSSNYRPHSMFGANTVKFHYIKTNSPLKSIFKKFQPFFLCVFCIQCLLERDHLWDCSKMVLKTTFEQSQRWSYYRNFTVLGKYHQL